MTKEEFIAKAKEYGYDDDGVEALLEVYDEIKAIDSEYRYEDIVLIEQAVY